MGTDRLSQPMDRNHDMESPLNFQIVHRTPERIAARKDAATESRRRVRKRVNGEFDKDTQYRRKIRKQWIRADGYKELAKRWDPKNPIVAHSDAENEFIKTLVKASMELLKQ